MLRQLEDPKKPRLVGLKMVTKKCRTAQNRVLLAFKAASAVLAGLAVLAVLAGQVVRASLRCITDWPAVSLKRQVPIHPPTHTMRAGGASLTTTARFSRTLRTRLSKHSMPQDKIDLSLVGGLFHG